MYTYAFLMSDQSSSRETKFYRFYNIHDVYFPRCINTTRQYDKSWLEN